MIVVIELFANALMADSCALIDFLLCEGLASEGSSKSSFTTFRMGPRRFSASACAARSPSSHVLKQGLRASSGPQSRAVRSTATVHVGSGNPVDLLQVGCVRGLPSAHVVERDTPNKGRPYWR